MDDFLTMVRKSPFACNALRVRAMFVCLTNQQTGISSMFATIIQKYRNTGTVDRALRSIVGMVFIYFGFIDSSYINQNLLAMVIGIMGVINILVAFSGVCPAYTLAGIRTCRSSESQEKTEA